MTNKIDIGLMRLQQDMSKRIKGKTGVYREALRELQRDCMLRVCDTVNEVLNSANEYTRPVEAMIELVMQCTLADFEDKADALELHMQDVEFLERCLACE